MIFIEKIKRMVEAFVAHPTPKYYTTCTLNTSIDIEVGLYKTLVVYSKHTFHGKKIHHAIGNYIVKEGNEVEWLDHESKLTNYSIINLN